MRDARGPDVFPLRLLGISLRHARENYAFACQGHGEREQIWNEGGPISFYVAELGVAHFQRENCSEFVF